MRSLAREFSGSVNGNGIEQRTDIAELIQEKKDSVILLRVNTAMMSDAGIHEGDVVAVDRSVQPQNNTIVVAIIGTEMVIRKMEVMGGRQVLVTPGRTLAPLDITGRYGILGVVLFVIKQI